MPDMTAEMLKVSALCAHTPQSARETLLLTLLAQWTRQRNLLAKGKNTFTPTEISEMLTFLEAKLAEARNA